ncbi:GLYCOSYLTRANSFERASE [Salix purpurea]|uniref:anthocyanidin 3-O-glucosyltransferase n=1 Tax=Salix purpurea TaxID=77065 RepID=A0A9Q1A3A3_SALPP|nr:GLYCOSYLTRANSFERASE [Salix purpurea]
MKKKQLVFVPVPGVGHLVSAVQLAKTILERDDSFLITMLAISNPFAGSMSKHTESLASMHPEIRFIEIPEAITAPPSEALAVSPVSAFTSYVNDHKTLVRDTIVKLVMADNPAPIASVVVDMFCTAFIDVARELGVPSHVFFTSGAAFLSLVLYLSDREDRGEPKFRPTDPDYTIPCFSNPVPYRVLPLLHSDVEYEAFANHGRKFKDSNGIIVNTFSEAESHAVSALLARNDISIRLKPSEGKLHPCFLDSYGEILPQGFLERTKNIGMLCGWAPQVEILAHKAVCVFVSHCGWNSILEALWYAVPVITWPLYGEQHMNAFQLVKELGLAVELTLDFRRDCPTDFVKAEEITKAVKSMMEQEG